MSDETSPFGVLIEMDDGYVGRNGALVAALSKKNPPDFSRPGFLAFRFRAPKPISRVETLAPGCTLRDDECLSVVVESLQPLENKLVARLRATNTRHDEPEDTGQDDNGYYQPSPGEQNVDFAQYDGQGSEARASFNQDEPEISPPWESTDRQHESQPAANAEQAKPFVQWVEADDIFKRQAPREWVCEKLQIGPGRSNFFVGAPSAGKTIGAQAFGVRVAIGGNAFDDIEFKINNPGPVAHIDYDQGQYDTFERYQAICNAYKIPFEAMRGKLRYVHRPPLHASDPASYDQWLRICEGLRLVIIDSLHGVMPGKDIMKPEFADGVYRLNAVSEKTGATILILAHTRKPSRDRNSPEPPEYAMLGTNQNFAAAGAAFHISKDTDGNRIFTMFKPGLGNRGRIVEPFALVFKQIPVDGSDVGGLLVTAETYEQVKAASAKKNQSDATGENLKKVVEYVFRNQGCTKTEIKLNVGIKGERAVAARDQAEREGYIRFDGKRYHVTDKGRQLLGLTPIVATTPPSSPDNAPEASDTSTDTPEPAKDA